MLKSFALSLALLICAPAFADKPEWAGSKGKPTAEQKEQHRSSMQSKEGGKAMQQDKQQHQERQQKKEKAMNSRDDARGLEKQSAKKSGQTPNELEKGSEQGQTEREQRRKWWKFWGE